MPTTLTEPIVFRFEYRDIATDELIRASGFSAVEFQINANTSLNEDDIYAESATQEGYMPEEYKLEVTVDPFFPLPEDPAERQFQLVTNVIPTPTVAVSYSVSSADSSICLPDLNDSTLIDASSVGLCTLTVTAEIAGGETLVETVEVRIIPETSQLVLLSPMAGDELVAIGADTMSVNFEWDAFNEPQGVTFELYLGGVLMVSNLEVHTYQLGSVDIGDPVWYVTMKDADGNVIETTPESSFTITRMEAVSAEFTIVDHNNTANTPDDGGNMVINTDTVTLDLSVDSPAASGNISYNWGGSLPLTVGTGASVSSEELTLTQGTPLAYSVILEVVGAGDVMNNVQTVTLVYEPPQPVLAVSDTTKTFHQVNEPILLNIENLDPANISITPPGPVIDPVNYTFLASQTGTYTLTGGGETLTLIVCGYAAGGSECWVLGAGEDNCETTCDTLTDPADGLTLDCVAGDWNDDNPNCSICQQLQSGAGCDANLMKASSAPYYDSDNDACKVRDSVDFLDNPLYQDCSAPVVSVIQRVCKCG